MGEGQLCNSMAMFELAHLFPHSPYSEHYIVYYLGSKSSVVVVLSCILYRAQINISWTKCEHLRLCNTCFLLIVLAHSNRAPASSKWADCVFSPIAAFSFFENR